MKKLPFLLFFLSALGYAQGNPFAAYMWNGSAWTPATSIATAQALTWNPPPASMYCWNSGLAEWVAADSSCFGGGGGGGVSSFSAGNLSPLFTTSVATATTTPALSFTLSTAAANSVFGNFTGSTAAPTFSAIPTFAITNLTGTCTACTANASTTATNIAAGSVGTIPYQSAAATTAMLAANTAATDQVLVSHGTGSAGQAPTLSNAPALSAANMTSFPAAGIAAANTCGPEYFIYPGALATSNGITVSTLNTTAIYSFDIPCSLTFNKITYNVSTADNSANTYDIGIYSATGSSLICHMGSTAGTTFASGTGIKTATMTGNCVLVAGTRYIAAMTSSASAVAKLYSAGTINAVSIQAPTGGGTTGGVLNSSLTVPADSYNSTGPPYWVLHN